MTAGTGVSTVRDSSALRAADTTVARILVVDDNASKRAAVKLVLAPLGHLVVEADSGMAAVQCVMENDFAVILMDVLMPGMDGFETVKLIRGLRQKELTPVLFITACTSEEIQQPDRYAGGAVDFIFAPIPPSELRAKVSFFAHVYIEAQRLAAQADAVQASVAQLRNLTDSAPIGIFQTDDEGRYVYTNPRWSEITGVPAELAVGRPWDSVMDEAARPHPDRLRAATLVHRFEVRGYEASRIGLITMQSMSDDHGWVGTLADATEEARANDALFAARDAALWASARQRNSAASAFHELRTPAASIGGYLEEVLASTTLDEDDRSMLDIAYRNSRRLNMLIDDIVVLDQCEIGASSMRLEPTGLAPLVERILLTFSPTADERGIHLLRACDDSAPSAMADPSRLEQALTNLVGNAIKFTPDGGSVTVGVVAGGGDQVTVTVTDTGMGIEADDCSRIFERFYRSRSATDGAIPGTGLGLAIAKAMVEAQNGSIAVSSQPGLGSTFSVSLPTVTEQDLLSVPPPAVGPEE